MDDKPHPFFFIPRMRDRGKYFSLSAAESPLALLHSIFILFNKYAKILVFCEDSYNGKYIKFKNL